MKGWYNAAADCALPHARLTIDQITAERLELYHHVPPPWENIPISVDTFMVDDSVPTEDSIEWPVRSLGSNRSGGPYGIRLGNLQKFLWG